MKPDDVFNKNKLKELYDETNEKFISRIQNMIYYICGCGPKRAKEILEECLRRNKEKEKKHKK